MEYSFSDVMRQFYKVCRAHTTYEAEGEEHCDIDNCPYHENGVCATLSPFDAAATVLQNWGSADWNRLADEVMNPNDNSRFTGSPRDVINYLLANYQLNDTLTITVEKE